MPNTVRKNQNKYHTIAMKTITEVPLLWFGMVF